MTRGDLVTITPPGDYGKARPALVVQSDVYASLPSVTVLPITGALRDVPLLRHFLAPDASNGLRKPSQIMIDKPMTLPRAKAGAVIGRLDAAVMAAVTRALAVFLGMG